MNEMREFDNYIGKVLSDVTDDESTTSERSGSRQEVSLGEFAQSVSDCASHWLHSTYYSAVPSYRWLSPVQHRSQQRKDASATGGKRRMPAETKGQRSPLQGLYNLASKARRGFDLSQRGPKLAQPAEEANPQPQGDEHPPLRRGGSERLYSEPPVGILEAEHSWPWRSDARHRRGLEAAWDRQRRRAPVVLLPTVAPGTLEALFCLAYYNWMGVFLMLFVTDSSSSEQTERLPRKEVVLSALVVAVANFYSSTTTKTSSLPARILRCTCDVLNAAHSLALILVSIWAASLRPAHASMARAVCTLPSMALFTGIPDHAVASALGIFNLLLSLRRAAFDLKMDPAPLLREVPVALAGIALLLLIPSNVTAEGETSPGEDPAALRCRGHVLSSGVAVALACLAAPPHRAFGAPRAATVVTSVWALAVTAAGITLGPESLPWPGLPFYASLSVLSLLRSKHTVS